MGNFQIANGKILDPAGNPWIMAGIAIGDPGVMNSLLTLFPKTNFIRIPCDNFEGPETWGPFVDAMGARGIACEVEYHPWPLIPAPTGAALQKLTWWAANWATWGLTRPYLIIGDMNEPQGGDITGEHVAVYNAVRGTGFKGPIILECGVGAGNPGNVGAAVLNPSAYKTFFGFWWGLHSYPWTNPTTNQDAFNAQVLGSAATHTGILGARAIQSADGLVPVVIEEFGPSSSGMSVEANAQQNITAVGLWAWQQGHSCGFAGWHWNMSGGPYVDDLTDSSGNLTGWGKSLVGYHSAVAAALQPTAATPAIQPVAMQAASQPAASPPPLNPNAQPGQWQSFNWNGMPWHLLLPDGYNPAHQYPVVLCLHQYQNDGAQPGQWDPWVNTAAFRARHPALVIVPRCVIGSQASTPTFNWGGVDPNLQQPIVLALQILQHVAGSESVDPNRFYITGNSMGGLGTWGVLANPDQRAPFAAAMPVSGSCYYKVGQESALASELQHLPIWSCHGGKDTQVPPQFDQTIMPLLLKLNPANKFTNDPNGQHDTWDAFYADPASWDWLFSQSKGAAMAASPNNTVIKPGAGAIADAAGNTWTVTAAGVIAVGGVPDTTSANVTKLAYVNGLVWQENKDGLWWSKSAPTAFWSPPGGTATSPVPPAQVLLDQALALIAAARAGMSG